MRPVISIIMLHGARVALERVIYPVTRSPQVEGDTVSK
jgi:hypothetical protein